jgi:putative membrane protein
MGFGFALARFGLFLREVAEAGHVRLIHGMGSAWFGVALVILGLVTNAAATVRYGRLRKALLSRENVPPNPWLVYGLGIGSVLVALAMAAMLARTLGE